MDLNSVIEEKGFYTCVDPHRGSLIADLDKLDEYVRHKEERLSLIIAESHLAHLLKPDVAVVLRAKPSVLTERLKQKGFPPQKIQENAEAETLDIILAEAVELCDVVYEVDTTDKRVEDVAAVVRAIIDAEVDSKEESGSKRREALREKYKPGSVDWTRFIEQVCLTAPYHYDEE